MSDEDQINEIMDWFNFGKVYETMVALDWKWVNETPSEGEIRKKARDLLKDLVRTKNCDVIGTGGFEAYRYGSQLGLRFVVSDWFVEGDEDVE